MNAVTETLTYSNPRTYFRCEDWPFGSQRCVAEFYVEQHPKRGQRIVRRTSKKGGVGWNAPKMTTYAPSWAIVDGSDGKTYLACPTQWGGVFIMRSDMKLMQESLSERDERLAPLRELLTNIEDNRPAELKPSAA